MPTAGLSVLTSNIDAQTSIVYAAEYHLHTTQSITSKSTATPTASGSGLSAPSASSNATTSNSNGAANSDTNTSGALSVHKGAGGVLTGVLAGVLAAVAVL